MRLKMSWAETDGFPAFEVYTLTDTGSGVIMPNLSAAKRLEVRGPSDALGRALNRAKMDLLPAAKRLVKAVLIPMMRFGLASPMVAKLPVRAVLRRFPWLHYRLKGMASRARLARPNNLSDSHRQTTDIPTGLTDEGRQIYLDLKSAISDNKAGWGGLE
jgi:hypothetical protein